MGETLFIGSGGGRDLKLCSSRGTIFDLQSRNMELKFVSAYLLGTAQMEKVESRRASGPRIAYVTYARQDVRI